MIGPGSKRVGMLAAAQLVLSERGKPAGYREIVAEAARRGLIAPQGRTPERTLYARLHEELRRNPETPFVLVSPGVFGLKRYPPKESGRDRAALVDWLVEMPPRAWEGVVTQLLIKMGFTNLTGGPLARDGAAHYLAGVRLGGVVPVEVAILGLLNRVELSRQTVRILRGSLTPGQAAAILSVGMPDPGAREEAYRTGMTPVTIIAGDELLELLRAYEIGPGTEGGMRLVV